MKELKQKKIWLSDLGRPGSDIEVLVGANTYAEILTGKIQRLDNSFLAIETSLGWTIFGREKPSELKVETLISMSVSSFEVDSDGVDLEDLKRV